MVEICSACGSLLVKNEVHVCPANKFMIHSNIEMGDPSLVYDSRNPANMLIGFDTKTEQISKLNDELENVKTESTYKDEYIIKLKKKHKKLLQKIQELYRKYLEKAIEAPELYDWDFMKIINDLLDEVVQDINKLLKPDK